MTFDIEHKNHLINNLAKLDGRILCIDHSKTRLGLAMSNKSFTIATPFKVIERKKFLHDIKQIQTIVNDWQIAAILLGLPFNMDGTSGARVQSVKTFAMNLKEHIVIPFLFWDERLSTYAAHEYMEEATLSKNKKRQMVDAHAATIILQNALDYWNLNKNAVLDGIE
jgi:putative Holliday junction resolvase